MLQFSWNLEGKDTDYKAEIRKFCILATFCIMPGKMWFKRWIYESQQFISVDLFTEITDYEKYFEGFDNDWHTERTAIPEIPHTE